MPLRFDCGSQFVLCTDPRFRTLVQSPLLNDILQPVPPEELVVLGAVGGAAMPRDTVRASGMFREPTKREEEQVPVDAPVVGGSVQALNFCGFLEG